MIFRRAVANLRAQNWTAQRIEKRETAKLLLELKPALASFVDFFNTAKVYYATTRAYSDRAFAGWRRDPGINDEQFVIAAYQASQIYVFGLNGENWAAIFGSERLRDIESVEVRRGLSNLMTTNFDAIETGAVATPYREDVRRVIPEDIQDAIRANCGDRAIPDKLGTLFLPPSCDLDLPDARFAEGAAALRARPDLVGQLRLHRAATATFISNLTFIEQQTSRLNRTIDASVR